MLRRRVGYEKKLLRPAGCLPEVKPFACAPEQTEYRAGRSENALATRWPLRLLAVLYDGMDTFKCFGKNLRQGRELQLVFGVLGHFFVKVHTVFAVNDPGLEGL